MVCRKKSKGYLQTLSAELLEQFARNTFYLAAKMPGHMMSCEGGAFRFTGLLANAPSRSPREVFEEQLEKCLVDYFDFYLLHNLCETSYEFYTNEEIGVVPYLLEQQQKGRIRHLGFSTHMIQSCHGRSGFCNPLRTCRLC